MPSLDIKAIARGVRGINMEKGGAPTGNPRREKRMEIKEPFFSVIIPTTGGRLKNLELVLTSLSVQHFPRQLFEVIVVNDGGEKEAGKLVRDFEGKFSGLLYVRTEKFEPLSFDQELKDIRVRPILDIWADGQTHGGYKEVPNIQPRNIGHLISLGGFLVFADSDIILAPDALSLYFQDMVENPHRVVLGVYNWLYPMHVEPEDIITRFDDVVSERLAKKLLTEVEPRDPKTGNVVQTHNICKDYRARDFEANKPGDVFTQPGHVNHALSCFSGNICWPRDIFEDVGGYTPYLHAGAHEDGYSGIDIYKRGHGISFDGRIIGAHLYHHRNIEWVENLKWKRGEIMWLNEQHADCPEMTDVIEMTRQEMERLGVADWKEKGKLGW